MSINEAIEQLNALPNENPEDEHEQADMILIQAIREAGLTELADAYESARDRVGFWYA